MANVRKLLSQLEYSTGEEIEQLSTGEAEEIEGGAKSNIGCTENNGCGPNTTCTPTPAPVPA